MLKPGFSWSLLGLEVGFFPLIAHDVTLFAVKFHADKKDLAILPPVFVRVALFVNLGQGGAGGFVDVRRSLVGPIKHIVDTG